MPNHFFDKARDLAQEAEHWLDESKGNTHDVDQRQLYAARSSACSDLSVAYAQLARLDREL